MKYLQNYDNFIKESIWRDTIVRNAEGRERTEDSLEIKLREFCDRHQFEGRANDWYRRNIKDFTITPDGKVNCSKDVRIYTDDLVNGKIPFKFGEVKGSFMFYDFDIYKGIPELVSLENCPDIVKKTFCCQDCTNIKSLEGCPQEVGTNFIISGCKGITNLDFCPEKIGGNFNCSACDKITSLKGCPKEINGVFNCSYCTKLESLKWISKKFGENGGIDCSHLNIRSLAGICVEKLWSFACTKCLYLTSLTGCPKTVLGLFDFSGCINIKTLRNAPKDMYSCKCDKRFSEKIIKQKLNTKNVTLV